MMPQVPPTLSLKLWRPTVGILELIQQVFANPPIPFEPSRQTLKNWAKYCLLDRGFKVVYAQNADFAVESQGKKLYVKLAEGGAEPDATALVLAYDRTTNTVQILPPISNPDTPSAP
jgi:hypothetical protein